VTDPSCSQEAALSELAGGCTRCNQLVASRTQVVFASGPVTAQLMLIGEAPGASEDREGEPFIGASGKLLSGLLEGIGLTREEVYITNVLKCRPPDNRDPRTDEISNCFGYLQGQVEIVRPAVVVTLGNFASKLMREDDSPITKVHGQAEPAKIGTHQCWLMPVFHPAAALYRRPLLELLRADFARLPSLISSAAPAAAAADTAAASRLLVSKPGEAPDNDNDAGAASSKTASQLDLF